MEKVKHQFMGQEFYEEQCRKNEAVKYATKRGVEVTEPRRCAYCGSLDYYAKNLCKVCYGKSIEFGDLTRSYEKDSPSKVRKRIKDERRAESFERKVCRKAFKMPYPMELPEEYVEQTTDMLGALNDKQTYVVTRHYKDCVSLQKIGNEIGLTRERVRQIETKALSKIKNGGKDINRSTRERNDASIFCGYNLSKRSAHALRKAKIKTMKQLGQLVSTGDVSKLKGVGSKSANELILIFTDWFYNRGK